MSLVTIPPGKRRAGERLGGVFVVIQAWSAYNLMSVGQLGPEGARITDGYGEWDEIKVPRRKGITEWRGRKLFQMTIDLLYDGWITHVMRPALGPQLRGVPPLRAGVTWSRPGYPTRGGGVWIEAWIAELERLAMIHQGRSAPDPVRLYGAVPHPELPWVITGLDWGDYLIDRQTGRRMRQQVTVRLLEFNQPTELQTLPRGKAS